MYDRYARLRNERGVTDYRVAQETGISRSTFSDWKSNRSQPKVDKLIKIAHYFGVGVEELLQTE